MSASAFLPQVAVLVPMVLENGEAWDLLFVNHDYASAIAKAAEWALANPGKTPVVMVYANHGTVEPQMVWAKK